MKKIAVLYATREGHTRRIAEHVAATLKACGFSAEAQNVGGRTTIDLRDHAAAVLAASVHAGSHEPEMIAFVRKHLAELNGMPSAFLSVTLSEAGVERSDATPEEHARFVADVEKMIDKFYQDTGWHPQRVKPVAGALLYTQYNFFIRYIMQRIARESGGSTDTSRDHEYTDWVALEDFVRKFAADIAATAEEHGSQPA